MDSVSEQANTLARKRIAEAANPDCRHDITEADYVRALAREIQRFSDAAKELVNERGYGPNTHVHKVLAQFILPDQPDPLLIEARKAAASLTNCEERAACYLRGELDDERAVPAFLAALKRGMEMAVNSRPPGASK